MGRHSTTKFVGLDVHSKSIAIAIADEGRDREVRHYEHPLRQGGWEFRRIYTDPYSFVINPFSSRNLWATFSGDFFNSSTA